jgi:hypothetical protein
VRSDSVDVEQIMKQIRARIREKRGADYTPQELQQLASVKLQQFADPSGLQSDLLEQFQQRSADPVTYHRHRGIRRLVLMGLHPILKPMKKQMMADLNPYFEIIHNLVVEVTRLGIEVQNLKMKVEALSSRVDFDERRARSLESVVQYRSDAQPRQRPHEPQRAHEPPRPPRDAAQTPGLKPQGSAEPGAAPRPQGSMSAGPNADGVAGAEHAPGPRPQGSMGAPGDGLRPDGERRRRRRRRRRRPGSTLGDRTAVAGQPGQAGPASPALPESDADTGPDIDGPDEDGGADDQ